MKCPNCKGTHVRAIDNEPLEIKEQSEQVAEGYVNPYDKEIYIKFHCDDCNDYSKDFTVTFDIIPRQESTKHLMIDTILEVIGRVGEIETVDAMISIYADPAEFKGIERLTLDGVIVGHYEYNVHYDETTVKYGSLTDNVLQQVFDEVIKVDKNN